MPLRFLTAGESHGISLTAILDGLPAGLSLSPDIINKQLARRQQGYGSGGRMKIEKDTVQILGGVMGGETTGAPIALLVPNDDHVKWKGKAVEPMTAPRPGHADLTGAVKYGYKDLRPALERAPRSCGFDGRGQVRIQRLAPRSRTRFRPRNHHACSYWRGLQAFSRAIRHHRRRICFVHW